MEYPQKYLYDNFRYFKNMSNAQERNVIKIDSTEGNCIFEELDREICVDEIKKAMDNLNRGKCHREDGILNEYLIEFQDYLLPILCS